MLLKSKSNKLKVVKRTFKFLFVALDYKVVRAVIKMSPDAVIRAISNAAVKRPPKRCGHFASFEAFLQAPLSQL